MIRLLSWVVLCIGALTCSISMAEEAKIPLTPGLYKVTVSSSSDKSSKSAKNVVDMCINKDLLDPKDFLPKAADCSLTNIKKEERKVAFDIDCEGASAGEALPVPAMKGTGECTTTESEFYCSYKIKGDIQGEGFVVNTERKGTRTGDCPE